MRKKLFLFIFLILFFAVSCSGIQGDTGKSAYEIYLKYHPEYTGTEEEWINEITNSYYYTVSFETNNESVIENQLVKKGNKIVKPEDPIKENYTFEGWYYQGEKWSFVGYVVTENMVLEARWKIDQYQLVLNKNIDNAGIVTGEGLIDYGEEVTINAQVNQGYEFLGWFDGNTELTKNTSYTFNMPATNVTYEARYEFVYLKGNQKIYFGSYPQTLINETGSPYLIAELNTKAGSLPTSSDLGNWTDYNYYVEGNVTSFMYYQDIDYDNNGIYDYRGIYLTQYRPKKYTTTSSDSSTYQDDNGFELNTVYWFSYDLIEWDILTESNGKALIIANLLLDSQSYNLSSESEKYEHNGGTGYANNYELSDIRKWLNDNFYNTAFNDLQKAIIETTTVDNSASTTSDSSNNYACNNTSDKMFLLSYSEVTTYYPSQMEKRAVGTDYAKCQGLYVGKSSPDTTSGVGFSYWWLRSPSNSSSNAANAIRCNGAMYDTAGLTNIDDGIRPVCWIKLQ